MDILRALLVDMRETLADWPMGTIIAILVLASVLILVGTVSWGLFVAVDSWFLPRKHKVGRVVGKTFTPAHTKMILIHNAATKTSILHPVFHSDKWSVSVEVDGRQDSVSVSEEFYNALSENDPVMTEYVSGRCFGGLYIKELSRA